MCYETRTFQELDEEEQELRRRLSEIEDVRYAMLHDPAFNFALLDKPADPQPPQFIDANFHRRVWIDAINEGVVTLRPDGTIDYCNLRFAEFVDCPIDTLIGSPFQKWVLADEQPTVELMLEQAQDYRAEGEFHLRSNNGMLLPVRLVFHSFDSDDLDGVCVVVTDITEQKRIQDNLQYVSTHDTLTGLFNQNYFYTELVRLEHSREYPLSVAFIDLDGMKAINEKLGHAAGDELLKRATAVLQSAFRVEDIVARVGGDEFAILLPNTDAMATHNAITRIRSKLTLHNATHHSPELSFSMGVATAEQGQSLAEVLRQADQSMYQDKHKHRRFPNLQAGIEASVLRIVVAPRNGQLTKTKQMVG